MAEKKSIMDEVLETIKQVEGAVNENAEEILRSTMSEEIGQILDASINEVDTDEDEEAEEVIDAEDTEAEDEIDTDIEIDLEDESDDVEADDVADAIDDVIGGGDLDTDEVIDVDYEDGMDTMVSDITDIDLTGAEDEEIIKVFKKLTDEDEIEVVSDNEVKITEPTTGTEYKVEMGGGNADAAIDDVIGDEVADEFIDVDDLGMEDEVEEELVYEIELDDEETIVAESDDEEIEEIEETSRTLGGGDETKGGLPKQRGSKSPAMKESIDFKAKYNAIIKEHAALKSENSEIKEAVKKLRSAFKETAIFSSNLAHATKLFTENSTNKAEKQSILKRFDEATSIDDSKKLYKAIKEELSSSNVSEKVEEKLTESATSSSSSQLNENRAYVDQSTKNILDLMKRVG